jgi:serine/threonine-protein kinase HipA
MTMTTERRFSVDLYFQPVGLLTVRGNLTTFEFFEGYLEQADRPVLGQLFEEEPRGRWRQAQRVPTWFSNLLPEDGPLLDFLADELAVSPRSEIRLLEALGSDLPGAVTVRPTADDKDAAGKRFDHEGQPIAAIRDSEGGLRFSVAGVQLKLSMVQDANTIRLAGRGEWGNRFVKFPGALPRIPQNEFAMMSLAQACGLDVPAIQLVRAGELGALPPSLERTLEDHVYVIERFDRRGDGPVHIEDVNQVVGNWPEDKYGGLSYESLGRLLLELCGEDDFAEYFKRLLFNISVGNEDSHLKNWSLIYPDRVNPRLSPLYDVVSTVVLPGFVRKSALRLAGSRRPQTFDADSMIRLASKAGGSAERAKALLDVVFERIRAEEQEIRSQPWLTSDEWATLDEYRRSVPLLRPLVR